MSGVESPPVAQRRRHRRRVLLVGALALVLLLAGARLALPAVLEHYVEGALDQSREYDGTLGAVRVRLWRGAYALEDVEITRQRGGRRTPFFAAERVDLAIAWRALLRGRAVGRIVVERPTLEFFDEAQEDVSGPDAGGAWIGIVESLFPFRLDSAIVRDGALRFRAPEADPPVDLSITALQGRVENLTNVDDRLRPRFATLEVRGRVLGDARLECRMSLDPTSYRPNFDLALRMLGLDVTEANSLARAYGSFDFERGELDLVVEIHAENGRLEGYVKPLFRDLQVFELDDLTKDPLHAFWNALVGAVTSILENPPADQFGTVIPLSGELDDPDIDLVTTVANVLRNAFVRAYLPTLEARPVSAVDLVFRPGTLLHDTPPR